MFIPGSGSRFFFIHPESRGEKGPGSAILLFSDVTTLERGVQPTYDILKLVASKENCRIF
jgi:hypothetical protein